MNARASSLVPSLDTHYIRIIRVGAFFILFKLGYRMSTVFSAQLIVDITNTLKTFKIVFNLFNHCNQFKVVFLVIIPIYTYCFCIRIIR